MNGKTLIPAVALVACLTTIPVFADDVTGADGFLCAIVEVSFCWPDGGCETGSAETWNIPDFIEIDLAGKELRTTKASEENRKTPIRNLAKEEGRVVVTGIEKGRAFTFAVDEVTGDATMTVASYGRGGVAFGNCTPLPVGR